MHLQVPSNLQDAYVSIMPLDLICQVSLFGVGCEKTVAQRLK